MSKKALMKVIEYKKGRRTAAVKRLKNSRRVPNNELVHKFRRGWAATWTGNVAYAPYLSGWPIRLSDVPNYTDFTNLFDQYRIKYVKTKWYLKVDPGAQAAASAIYPKIYYSRDYNDTTAPANLGELRERGDCKFKVLRPDRPVIIKFKPNLLQSIFTSGTAVQEPVWDKWLNTSASDTPYCTIKWAFDDLTNTNYKVECEAYFYIECKNSK